MLLVRIRSPYVYRRVADKGARLIQFVVDLAPFGEGIDKLKQACDAVGRDVGTWAPLFSGASASGTPTRKWQDLGRLEETG